MTLVDSLAILVDDPSPLEAAKTGFAAEARRAEAAMWAAKLGLVDASSVATPIDWTRVALPAGTAEAALELWAGANALMTGGDEPYADWTIFWRQLGAAARAPTVEAAFAALEPAWYAAPPVALARRWRAWLERWRNHEPDGEGMDAVNPVFVPREWMLVEAYEAAERGDGSLVDRLQAVFARPYFRGVDIPWRRVAATPRLRRGDSAETSRGDAAAGT